MKFAGLLNAGRAGISLRGFCSLCYFGLLLMFATGCERGLAKPAGTIPHIGVGNVSADSGPQRLSSEGAASLNMLLEGGVLADLRWPSFQTYQTEVKEFYGSFNDTLPWLRDSEPTPQALAIIQALKHAETKGLRHEDYDGPRWNERIKTLQQGTRAPEADLILFDLALTVSVMRYISDLHMGRVNPRLSHFGLDINRKHFDLSEFLRLELVTAKDVDAVVASVEPPFPGYHQTVEALNQYVKLVQQDSGELLPVPAKTIRPGDSYVGIQRLTQLLQLLGDLREPDIAFSPGTIYEGHLIDAVKHFQQRHGLDPNGQIDAHTVRQLNIPLGRRVAQLELTLERWRWLPHQFERPPIVVNIPAFRLYAANEEYQVGLSMKVVVGKAYRHETPVFASEIKSVIFRPYWNVPLGIQQNELVPKIEEDASYLTEDSYEIVDARGDVVSEGEVSDELLEKLRSGKLAIRQRPGSDNALGLIKFEFPNQYDVYMHDTPAKDLFSRSRRDFSHGCIRVEDPVGLAVWALKDQPEWTRENILAALNGEETMRVDIKTPIPVLILYATAVAVENGEVEFYDDIYGYDAELERALIEGYPHPD
jgi:L,D-transpeptidase YcbB